MAARDANLLWPVAAAFLLALAGVCVAVFWPDPPTSLRVSNPQHNSGGEGVGHVPAGTPYVFAGYPLCVAHGGVTIKSVVPHDPQGIKVVDWAAAAAGTYPVNVMRRSGKAHDLHGFSRKDITQPCSKPQAFAISVQRTAKVGIAHGFEITSTSGTVLMPFSVQLCAGACPAGNP